MSTSPAQFVANAANAQNSTGPRKTQSSDFLITGLSDKTFNGETPSTSRPKPPVRRIILEEVGVYTVKTIRSRTNSSSTTARLDPNRASWLISRTLCGEG
jgi:hypothetical protein